MNHPLYTSNEPLSRTTLLNRRRDVIEENKRKIGQGILSDIRSNVYIMALSGRDTKYIKHIKSDTLTIPVVHESISFEFKDIKDQVMSGLRDMFPDCKIEYVERAPVTDPLDEIFGSRANTRNRQDMRDDGVERAIVIDWT